MRDKALKMPVSFADRFPGDQAAMQLLEAAGK